MQINTPPRCYALVPCAGSGQRAGPGGPKQYRLVAGRPVVGWTLAALQQVLRIHATLVVLSPDDERFELQVPGFAGERGWVTRAGGDSRAETVLNGLQVLVEQGAQPHDWVLVHDAARCLIQPAWVNALLDACWDDEVGGLLALPLADTLKQSDAVAGSPDNPRVQSTVDRTAKWAAQTPQMFRLGLLRPALAMAGPQVTDEASAVELLGHTPRLVAGALENFKLTWPQDFELAERLLSRPAQGSGATLCADGTRAAFSSVWTPMNTDTPASAYLPTLPTTLRIGEGWDIHALVSGRKLMLGGVDIPHTHGLLGHSDADALLHAVTDALLGAAGLGDIGQHFPDTDERFKGADSLLLLAQAMRSVREAGWELGNIDSTIVAQAPKLAAYIPAMRAAMAQALDVSADQVHVKAKTAEKMGPVGEKLAIEARAVCLLLRR